MKIELNMEGWMDKSLDWQDGSSFKYPFEASIFMFSRYDVRLESGNCS